MPQGMAVVGSREGVHFHSPHLFWLFLFLGSFFVFVFLEGGLLFFCFLVVFLCLFFLLLCFFAIEIFSIANLLGDHGEEAR